MLVFVLNKEREFMDGEEIDYSQYVYYDETSPTYLRWKVDRSTVIIKDSVAGYVSKINGVVTGGNITICGKDYQIHRVVWTLHHGEIPERGNLFYKDKDKSNFKISNLELKIFKAPSPKVYKEKEPTKYSIFGTRPMRIFSGMKSRCGYNPAEGLKYYEDKTICQEWLDDPTLFYKFVVTLDNYAAVDDKGKLFHIEKDLFGINSDVKGYHPNTVCFLPRDLNQVIQLEHHNQRTKNKGLPIGVTEDRGRFKAQISNGSGKPKYLGSGTIEECSELYKRAKIERIEELTQKWRHMLSNKILNQLDIFVSHLKAI